MRNSIARKVTRWVGALLLAALIMLFVGSFFVVQQLVFQENTRYSQAVVGMYADMLLYCSWETGLPITVENGREFAFYGEYICRWYGVDYAYVYIPYFKGDFVEYVYAVGSIDADAEFFENFRIGDIVNNTNLTQGELDVWNGDETFATIVSDNEHGYELGTIVRIVDNYGNKALVGIDMNFNDLYEKNKQAFSVLAIIITLVFGVIVVVLHGIVKKMVSRPATIISRSMNDFISKDGKHSLEKLEVKGCDEYEMIANAFNSMTDDIDSYITNIQNLHDEQERSRAELDIAAKIQKSFLPPENMTCDICRVRATMHPARLVGGDMYDYFNIDDDNTVIVAADVSGKGTSAAMVMTVTFTVIRQLAKLKLSPAAILKATNEILCENNKEMMFVTAVIGIYNGKTNTLTYSNAGHNPPYIVGKQLKKLDGAQGAILGLFDGEEYSQETVSLEKDDTVFLYTDGVTEATNKNNEFYGTERLEKTLMEAKMNNIEDSVEYVKQSLREYIGDSAQHDDITMLALTPRETTVLYLDPNEAEFEKIKSVIFASDIPRQIKMNLCLAAEEYFVNICMYAFPGGKPEGEKIKFTFAVSDRVEMILEDGGKKYNPLENIISPEEYDIETQVGGLGKLMATAVSDDVHYEYKNKKNILKIINFLEGLQ